MEILSFLYGVNFLMPRSMGGIVSHVKQLLSTYQKKTDYRPEIPEVAEGTQVTCITKFMILFPLSCHLSLSLSLTHIHPHTHTHTHTHSS